MKQSITLRVLVVSFFVLAIVPAAYPQCPMSTVSQPSIPSGDNVLIEDSLPSGANVTVGSVNWDTSQYAAGSQSFNLSGSGTNTVRIEDLSQFENFDGKVILYVLLDSCSATQEIKITYSSAYRNVSVYWGTNLISGPYVNFRRGNLPSAGVWTRLEIPTGSPLALQGHTLTTIEIQTYDGQVWFDHLGKDSSGCVPATASSVSLESGDTVWVDDSVPSGADLWAGDFHDDQAAQGTQSLVYPYFGQTATGAVYVVDMNEATSSGDNLFLYVMPTSCKTLNELKITWYSSSASGCIYYGTVGFPSIGGESSCTFMGSTVPTADTWNRIEIPASTVGLDGASITKVKVENIGSKVWVDAIGKQTP